MLPRFKRLKTRVIAATHVGLLEAVHKGKFREDLYYRLTTLPMRIPPLRERGEDIVLLFRKFAADFAEQYHTESIQLTEEAKESFTHLSFPRQHQAA